MLVFIIQAYGPQKRGRDWSVFVCPGAPRSVSPPSRHTVIFNSWDTVVVIVCWSGLALIWFDSCHLTVHCCLLTSIQDFCQCAPSHVPCESARHSYSCEQPSIINICADEPIHPSNVNYCPEITPQSPCKSLRNKKSNWLRLWKWFADGESIQMAAISLWGSYNITREMKRLY